MALLVLAEVACHAARRILDHRSRERFADGHRAREWHAAVTRDHARDGGEATMAHTSSSPDGCGPDAGDVAKAKRSSRNSRKQRTPQP